VEVASLGINADYLVPSADYGKQKVVQEYRLPLSWSTGNKDMAGQIVPVQTIRISGFDDLTQGDLSRYLILGKWKFKGSRFEPAPVEARPVAAPHYVFVDGVISGPGEGTESGFNVRLVEDAGPQTHLGQFHKASRLGVGRRFLLERRVTPVAWWVR
ncbi:MAG: hypothetical protein ABIG67_02815, partial [Pseudomonadota bacterium]